MQIDFEITGPSSDEDLARFALFLVGSHARIPKQHGQLDPIAHSVWRSSTQTTLATLMGRHPEAAGYYFEAVMPGLEDQELLELLDQVARFVLD